MTIYFMLAAMSGIVMLEAVTLGIINASRNQALRSAFAQVGEIAGFVNGRIIPMIALALWGGVLLKAGETIVPFGTLLQMAGAVSFSSSLVVLLNYLTSDSR